MEPNFSGYATKAGLKCADGRTIMPNAFKDQDQTRVPLVWQHSHNDPKNVLGHAILENRNDGVYTYGYFNATDEAKHAQELLEHGDINMLSIWANQLIERSGRVIHGAIKEVSLVLSGANPGALIENVTLKHGDGDIEVLDEEAIIFTGLELEHGALKQDDENDLKHDNATDTAKPEAKDADTKEDAGDTEGLTVQDVYDSLDDVQKEVVNFMIGEALASASDSTDKTDSTDSTDNSAAHSNTEKDETPMRKNVFEQKQSDDDQSGKTQLTHDDMKGILEDAARRKVGSLKEAIEDYALAHGIESIDVLFPEVENISENGSPEFLSRRVEWVGTFLSATRKSPFSRIKTLSADITLDEARAKGYVKGNLKKEEFFAVAKRVTTPTTVYKRQKLDRDDMVDITDFDVVAWLKAEMRLMLDEEIARAALVGDGRDFSHPDKINEQNIRPIATDNDLFATKVYVNILDTGSSVQEFIDAVVTNRWHYKGSGLPMLFTSETMIAKFLLLKDTTGRRIYSTLADIAAELRCTSVVPVQILEEYPNILGIFVNPTDYVFGATKGGEISMFDFFDIDYNQYKYLMETRCCGALTKLKSALVVLGVNAGDLLVTPAEPTFDPATGHLTIVNETGVVYKKADGTVINAGGSPYTVTSGTTLVVNATPATGYYFASSEGNSWAFTAE